MADKNGVLVVGGGFIGTAAARTLASCGHPVSVLTRAPAPLVLDNINWIYGSTDYPHLTDLLQGVGAVICASGTIAPGTKIESVAAALSHDLIPVVRLAERAAESGVRRLIFISSGGTVYGQTALIPTPESACTAPINTYGLVKVVSECALLDVARRTDLSVTILRVSNPYGPGQIGNRQLGFVGAAIHAALNGTVLTIWGDGLITRDFVFIDDLARAIALAVTTDSHSSVLNIGSGVGTSLLEVCAMVSRATGKEICVAFEKGRSVDVKFSTLDIVRAGEVLGWRPEVNLEGGISRTATQLS